MELAAAGCGAGAATDMVGKAAAKRAGAPASSRTLNVCFMVTPPRCKLPARLLNHRASKKSRTNVCLTVCPANHGRKIEAGGQAALGRYSPGERSVLGTKPSRDFAPTSRS
jgi:hypothetical protein